MWKILFLSFVPLKKIVQLRLLELSKRFIRIAGRYTFHAWANSHNEHKSLTRIEEHLRDYLKSVAKRDSVNLDLALPSKDMLRVNCTIPVCSLLAHVLNVIETVQMGAPFGCDASQQSLATTSLTKSRLFLPSVFVLSLQKHRIQTLQLWFNFQELLLGLHVVSKGKEEDGKMAKM